MKQSGRRINKNVDRSYSYNSHLKGGSKASVTRSVRALLKRATRNAALAALVGE